MMKAKQNESICFHPIYGMQSSFDKDAWKWCVLQILQWVLKRWIKDITTRSTFSSLYMNTYNQ
jgi:hypothetical protein